MSRSVLLYGSRRPLDQFGRVPDLLRGRGIGVMYERLWGDRELRMGLHALPEVIGRADLVAFADLSNNLHLRPTRIARNLGRPTALLVDGVVEFANVFMNPWMGPEHLRPAPQDVVMAMGALQGSLLRAMGHDPVVTGLPRLDLYAERLRGLRRGNETADIRSGWLVVATANTPALSDAARSRLVRALTQIRDAATRRGVTVRWRIDRAIAGILGVEADGSPLVECMAGACAVLTTASTLAVEGMIAGVPTGVFHPHPWPLWVPGAWQWHPDYPEMDGDAEAVRAAMDRSAAVRTAADGSIRAIIGRTDPIVAGGAERTEQQAEVLIESLLSPEPSRMVLQDRLLEQLWTEDSSRLVCGVMERVMDDPSAIRRSTTPVPTLARTTVHASRKSRPRVVSLIMCGKSPVGGVTNWSIRMGRAFASDPALGYEFHTVAIGTDPLNFEVSNLPDHSSDRHLHACVLDPASGTHERVRQIESCVRALDPDIVIPNYDDESFVVASGMQASGVRCLAIAHVEDPDILRCYREFACWEAGVGVSRSCVRQLESIADGRPVSQIVYGVPVADAPRRSDRGGPIRLAYLGRLVEHQKRISDLILLLQRLEELGVEYRFDVVGDGPEARSWAARVREMGLLDRRVFMHGRRPMEWVESFLPEVDCSVLVSGWEGTSIAMLEAMGAGVVPCVTAVSSGVDEWVEDGVNGVVAPVGRPEQMAERIAWLASDRDRIDRLGACAHRRMVERRMTLADMAGRYAQVFDALLQSSRRLSPASDSAVRLPDRSVWSPRVPDDLAEADRWVLDRLSQAGYERIAMGASRPGCDAVFVSSLDRRPDPATVRAWRSEGLGVGVAPNLCVESSVLRMQAALDRLIRQGCRRIAVFGAGTQSAALIPPLRAGAPIVGWIDDSALPGTTHMGLPVVGLDHVGASLRPDGVLLNTDRYEPLLAWRCEALEGVRIAAVCRDDETLRSGVERIRVAKAGADRGECVYAACDGDMFAYGHAIGATKIIAADRVADAIADSPCPSLVFVASVMPRDELLGMMRAWIDRDVGVIFWSGSPLGDGATDHVDHGRGEAVEAESRSAAAGDCVRKPVSVSV